MESELNKSLLRANIQPHFDIGKLEELLGCLVLLVARFIVSVDHLPYPRLYDQLRTFVARKQRRVDLAVRDVMRVLVEYGVHLSVTYCMM